MRNADSHPMRAPALLAMLSLAGAMALALPSPAFAAQGDDEALITSIEDAMPAVVTIRSVVATGSAGSLVPVGSGSGVVVDPDGLILTNGHVVGGADAVTVILEDGTVMDGTVTGVDTLTDFAMFGAVAFETLAVASVFVFRRTRPDAERPYRCLGYPLVPAIYVLVMAAVFVNMFATPEQRGVAMIGLVFILSGAVVYELTFRRRS